MHWRSKEIYGRPSTIIVRWRDVVRQASLGENLWIQFDRTCGDGWSRAVTPSVMGQRVRIGPLSIPIGPLAEFVSAWPARHGTFTAFECAMARKVVVRTSGDRIYGILPEEPTDPLGEKCRFVSITTEGVYAKDGAMDEKVWLEQVAESRPVNISKASTEIRMVRLLNSMYGGDFVVIGTVLPCHRKQRLIRAKRLNVPPQD